MTVSVNNSANVMTLRTFVVNRCNSLAFHVLGLYGPFYRKRALRVKFMNIQ